MKPMSDAQAARVQAFNEQPDTIWYGKCRHCGEKLKGSMAQLRAHVCKGGTDDPNPQPSPSA